MVQTYEFHWNRYPETKPETSGEYAVTISHKFWGTDYRHVCTDMNWSSKHQMWNVYDDFDGDDLKSAIDGIVAWAEATYIPYLGDAEEGMEVKVSA